jgi:hypothetical protein
MEPLLESGFHNPFQKKMVHLVEWTFHWADPIKKPLPPPHLQILPSPTFLLDATVESYNRDPSILPSQKEITH